MNNKRETHLKLLFVFGFILLCSLILIKVKTSTASTASIIDDEPKVYWSDLENGRIWRANLDGSQVETVPELGFVSRPEALTIDVLSNEMYFVVDNMAIDKTDLNGGSRQRLVEDYLLLWRPNSLTVNHEQASLFWTDSGLAVIGELDLAGGSVVFQLPPGPTAANGLAIDENRGQVYWTNYGRLYQSNLNGSDSKLFIEFYGVADVALDLNAGKMYFAESLSDFYGYSIKRANLDGSNIELLASYEQGRSDGIALDLNQGKIYWSERGTTPRILRANLDGTAVEPVIDKNIFGPFGLAIDTATGKLYWADWVSQKIQRANLDGSEVEDLLRTVPARPRYLALDTAVGKMFWTGNHGAAVWQANLDGSANQALVPDAETASTGGIALHKINGQLYWIDAVSKAVTKANMDGTAVEKIIYRRLKDPQGLAIDEKAGKMYWADREQDTIFRANLDGTAVEPLVTKGLDTPTSLALDLLHGKIIWTDPILRQISQANLDGSNVELLLAVEDGLKRPNLIALDISAGKMYWTDYGTKTLRRANLDGTNIEDLVRSGIIVPSGLALKIPPVEIHHIFFPLTGRD